MSSTNDEPSLIGAGARGVAAPTPSQALVAVLRPVRGRLALSVATAATGSVAGVVGLVLLGATLHEVTGPQPDRATISWLLGIALLAMVGRFALRKLSFDQSHLASFDLETVLRRDLATHLGRLPLGRVQQLGSGTIKKIVQDDVRALHGAVADATPMLGAGLAQPVAALVAIGFIDWRLLLAVLAVVPVIAIGTSLVTRDYETMRREYDEANEAVNEAVVEFVQGMPVVRTFDDGTTSFRRFADRVQTFTRATEAWQDKSRTAGVLTRVAMTPLPTLVLVMAVGTLLVLQGSISPLDVAVVAILGTLPVESIVPLMYLSQFVTESKAGAARIRQVLDLAPLEEPVDPRRPSDGSVRFTDVSFGYDGTEGRPALQDLNLFVPDGTVCALVGASGSGKSTVARLIPRFWDVTAGAVEVGGVDVRHVDSADLLRHIALVFQETFLVDASVADNIRLGRDSASDHEVEQAARAAQVHHDILGLPEGYATIVGEGGGRLSGGQRQRLTIARALLSPAPVVVLDEATAFTDPENEAAIQDAVAELTRGRTVIVIAHRLSTIVDADQIIVLDAGRVVESGTHHDLVAAGGRYRQMWRHHEDARTWGLSATREDHR